VQRVEILGLRHLPPEEVLARLQVDTFASVWQRLDPLERRVRAHPDLETADIARRLPGTLVVTVRERAPVALVPSPAGMRAYDGRGVPLPLDLTRAGVDAPVVASPDSIVLRLLDHVRLEDPALFARISEVRRAGSELLVIIASLPVRARSDLSAARLAEVIPVEDDLRRRGAQAAELDLRYRDQVIARLQ
jgi:cell division protein FtsQ